MDRWWEHEIAPDRLVAGVFEGGGAKGMLYEGAVRALVDLERPRWFSHVAGASAGAITALLIAAGLRPEEIAAETNEALATLDIGSTWKASKRLRRGEGLIRVEPLESWLANVLARGVIADLDRDDPSEVTFADLFDLTGIELHVVAVDIDERSPVVFNHRQTPDAQLVAAVLASAAIPIAFPPLQRKGNSLVVDGGVSSNYPTFVFKDRSFRHHAGLPPVDVPVVGFLLDESRAAPSESKPVEPTSLVRRIGALPLLVFGEWLPDFFRWNSNTDPPRFPSVRKPTGRRAANAVDGVFVAAQPSGVFVASTIVMTLTIGLGGYLVLWRPLGRTIVDTPSSVGEALNWVLTMIVLALFSLIPVFVWLIVMVTFILGVHVWPAVRLVGDGLTRTLLANPGAPPWAGAHPDDHVIRLIVRPGLTTLRCDLDASARADAIDSAQASTKAGLLELDRRS